MSDSFENITKKGLSTDPVSGSRGLFFFNQPSFVNKARNNNGKMNFSSTTKEILKLLNSQQKENVVESLRAYMDKYSKALRKEYYLADGGSIIHWFLTKHNFSVDAFALFIDDMNCCDVITEVTKKEGFSSLKTVLGGQKMMIRFGNMPSAEERESLIEKIKVLLRSKAEDEMIWFLKNDAQEYFSEEEKQKHFPCMLSLPKENVLNINF